MLLLVVLIAAVVGLPVLYQWIGKTIAQSGASPGEDRRSETVKMRALPIVRIADLTPGQVVRIVGKPRAPASPVVAPFSGRACLFYDTTVEQKIISPVAGFTTETLASETSSAPLVIDDGSGAIAVVAYSTRLVPEAELREVVGPLDPGNASHRAFADRYDLSKIPPWSDPDFQFHEVTLELDRTLAISGVVTSEAVPDAPGVVQLTLASNERVAIRISDDPSITA